MNTTEMVISFIIGAMVMMIYEIVKLRRELRKRMEDAEESREVSNLILEVLDYPSKADYAPFDYAAFFRKRSWIYERIMEISSDMWFGFDLNQRKGLIKIASDEYDQKGDKDKGEVRNYDIVINKVLNELIPPNNKLQKDQEN